MKKFFKWSAIIAGIMLGIGLAFVMASSVMGGRQAVLSLKEELKNVEWDELENVLDAAEGFVFNIGKEGLSISVNEDGVKVLTVNGTVIEAGESSARFEAAEVDCLNLNIGAGELTIREKETDDGYIDLSISGIGNCNYYVEGRTLSIEGFSQGVITVGNMASVSEIVLEIPAGMHFEEVEVEAGAGMVVMTGLQARELETVIGAGELDLERITADEFSTEVGAGQVTALEMDVKNAEIHVSMGECIYKGWVKGNLDAECDMGNLELDLKGKQSDHDFQIECSAGNIEMDWFEVTGFAAERTIDNGAVSQYDISCNMGNITVEFEEE